LKIAPLSPEAVESFDPSVSLRALAARLEAASVADPANSAVAKELRSTLMLLMPNPQASVDAELKLLMSELSRPVPRSETRDLAQ